MSTNRSINYAEIRPFHEKVNESADKITSYFILGYFIFGFAIAPIHGTWILAGVMGGLSLGIFLLIRYFLHGSPLYRLVTALLLWNFPLQFILQTEGNYVMSFFYFVSLTVLLFYENKNVLLPTIVYAFASYIFLFFIQTEASALSIDLKQLEPLGITTILHLVLMALYAGLCILWSNIQRKQTRESAINYIQMNEQIQLMEVNIQFANTISQGNLNADYPADNFDKLGESLLNMQRSLSEAASREKKEKFVNVGLASISEILRNHVEHIDILSDTIIEKLVNYMKANQGGLFIIEEDNDGQKYLSLAACRAYERKKFLERRVELGEGLIGQTALEKETLIMTEVPEGYLNITSGLGLASPSCLIIVPLKSNDEVVGVVEMASFREFDDTDVEFLEKVGESIASTIISAKTNQQTKALLEKSHQMTEELHAQEEEMRQNMEEMQATQEEMGRTQKELAEKESNLNALINNTNDSIITIDRNYKIIVMNDVIKNRYKGTEFEGMGEGSNALDMLGSVAEEWKGYYDQALAGERLNFTLESSVKGENTWREYFINPIFDDRHKVIGASIFSRDVTDKIVAQKQLAYEKSLFQALMDYIPDFLYYKDMKSRFLKVSKSMLKNFSVTEESEILGKSDFDFFDEAHARPAYDNEQEIIATGKPLLGKLEQEIHKDGKETWAETTKMPLFDESGEIIGTFGISKDVTQSVRTRQEVVFKSNVLQSMVETIPDAIATFDKDYQIVIANDAIRQRFERDGISHGKGSRLPAEGHWKSFYDRALSGERFTYDEKKAISKNSFEYYRYIFGPVKDQEGETIGGTLICRPIREEEYNPDNNGVVVSSKG